MPNILQITPCVANTSAVYDLDGEMTALRVHAWGLNGDGEVVGLVQQVGSMILLPADDCEIDGKFVRYETNPDPVRVYGAHNDDCVGVITIGG